MIANPALLVEQNVAEWLRAQAVVPGVELHDDPDITWVVTAFERLRAILRGETGGARSWPERAVFDRAVVVIAA